MGSGHRSRKKGVTWTYGSDWETLTKGTYVVLALIVLVIGWGYYLPAAVRISLLLSGWLMFTVPAILLGVYLVLLVLTVFRGKFISRDSAWILDDPGVARLSLRDPYFEIAAAGAGVIVQFSVVLGALLWAIYNRSIDSPADFSASIGTGYVTQPYAALNVGAAILYTMLAMVTLALWYANVLHRRTKNLLRLIVINSSLPPAERAATLEDIVTRTEMKDLET
jgi:hypothetical protein